MAHRSERLRTLVAGYGEDYARIASEHVDALADVANALLEHNFATSDLRDMLSHSRELPASTCRLLAIVLRELASNWAGAVTDSAAALGDVEIAIATPAEINELAAFHIANHIVATGHPPVYELYQMRDLEADFPTLLNLDKFATAIVYVARRKTDQLLVGCAALVPDAEHPQRAKVELVSVATQLQRNGLGRRLVETVLARAEHDGVETVELICLPEYNVAAYRLYETLGFKVVAEIFPPWDLQAEDTRGLQSSGCCQIVTMRLTLAKVAS